MLKKIVHIIKVNQRGQKIQLQVKLPLNAKRILDVKVTANPSYKIIEGETSIFPTEVGWIWLRLSELRDVFYCENIKLKRRNHNQTFLNHKPIDDFDNGTFWTQGKQEQALNITAELDTNLLEGYYIDRFRKRAENEYELKIYLTLEI